MKPSGARPGGRSRAIRGQIGKGGDLLVPALLPGTTKAVERALSDRHGELFKAGHLQHVEPFADAAALLRLVHDTGRSVVLASSADAREVKHYVALLKVKGVVDATTSIDDVATSKPAGDIFAAALKKVKPLRPGSGDRGRRTRPMTSRRPPDAVFARSPCGRGALTTLCC